MTIIFCILMFCAVIFCATLTISAASDQAIVASIIFMIPTIISAICLAYLIAEGSGWL